MRQRNDTDYDLVVGADPVLVAAPGDEIEYEHEVAGLTVVAEPPVALDPPAAKKAFRSASDAEEATPCPQHASEVTPGNYLAPN